MSAYARHKQSKENVEVYSTDETYSQEEAGEKFQTKKYYQRPAFETQYSIVPTEGAAFEDIKIFRVSGDAEKFDIVDTEILVFPSLTDFTYDKSDNSRWISYKGIDWNWILESEVVENNVRSIWLEIHTRFHKHNSYASTATIRGNFTIMTECPVTIAEV